MSTTLISTIVAIIGLIATFFLGKLMQSKKVSALVTLVATLCDAIADGKIDNAEVTALTEKVVTALNAFGVPKPVAAGMMKSVRKSS